MSDISKKTEICNEQCDACYNCSLNGTGQCRYDSELKANIITTRRE